MKIHDISLGINPELPTWPGDPPVIIERIDKIEDGALANVSRIDISAHTGTHIDAPFHFLGDGTATVDKIPLETLCGTAYVLHIPDDENLITKKIVKNAKIPSHNRRLLIRTRNSNFWRKKDSLFHNDYVGIDPECAEYLVEKGIKLIGIDYLSIAPYDDLSRTHKTLLEAGVIILEGLNLLSVDPGFYTLLCLPLKLEGTDGAPARAILIDQKLRGF